MAHPTMVRNPDGSIAEHFHIPLVPGRLERLFRKLFEEHWRDIIFGPCIQGAVFEIRLTEKPKRVSMLDGYLTVDTGSWHFHVCIDEHRQAATPELARRRQASRAVFFHDICENGVVKGSWGLRLWNGCDEQMLTVFFPNPCLTDEQQILKEPDWSRLALWERLRDTYSHE